MPVIPVDEASDPRVAAYRTISDAELLEKGGLFVAEGRLVVHRLLLARPRLVTRSLLVTAPALQALGSALEGHEDVPVYLVPQAVMNTITGFNMHRGCLAIGVRPPAADWRTLVRPGRRILVLERVANADNVGACFRNAAAFGVEAVLLEASCTDPLYRKAVRTSMAAVLSMPHARLEPWPQALCDLRADGWTLVALTPAADACALGDVAPRLAGARVAVVLGHEGDGLTDAALAACDVRARVPMASGVDSLNVATAAAVALYELSVGGSADAGGRGTRPTL